MKLSRFFKGAVFALSTAFATLASLPTSAATVTDFKLSVSQDWLLALNKDWSLPHEGTPLGVPTGYDWAQKGRIGYGNTVPSGFNAMTGWAQIFRNTQFPSINTPLQLRNFQTLVCYGPSRTWVQLQQGTVAGAAFAPDFIGNVSQPAQLSLLSALLQNVQFALGTAFHFWPSAGRATLPSANICGWVVLMEARVDTTSTASNGGYLLGFGMDYWQSLTAVWNQQYTTNKDAGVGRLKKVTKDWQWFGMSTASDADLQNLFKTHGAATTTPSTTSPPTAPGNIRIN